MNAKNLYSENIRLGLLQFWNEVDKEWKRCPEMRIFYGICVDIESKLIDENEHFRRLKLWGDWVDNKITLKELNDQF